MPRLRSRVHPGHPGQEPPNAAHSRMAFDRLAGLAFPLLQRMDAERAHGLALIALQLPMAAGRSPRPDPRLQVEALGLTLPNPIGLAAGFDKDARALSGLMRLGFGAIEAGTVTRRPQSGNPKPRLFRLREDAAVINRMGFNNAGIQAFRTRFSRVPRVLPLGANIGLNRGASDPLVDYPMLVAAVAERADWITVNVSSPNTPGLRDLQGPRRLQAILRAISAAVPAAPPLLVKLAPDLPAEALPDIVEASIEVGAAGLVLTNTTTARPETLRSRHAQEAGGLSGRPLLEPSTALLAAAARLARGRLVLVGVGGVASGADVLAKLQAGASFVQLYTAFALQGPALLPRLQRELRQALDQASLADVTQAIGTGL